jgi:hypothetical protein
MHSLSHSTADGQKSIFSEIDFNRDETFAPERVSRAKALAMSLLLTDDIIIDCNLSAALARIYAWKKIVFRLPSSRLFRVCAYNIQN